MSDGVDHAASFEATYARERIISGMRLLRIHREISEIVSREFAPMLERYAARTAMLRMTQDGGYEVIYPEEFYAIQAAAREMGAMLLRSAIREAMGRPPLREFNPEAPPHE